MGFYRVRQKAFKEGERDFYLHRDGLPRDLRGCLVNLNTIEDHYGHPKTAWHPDFGNPRTRPHNLLFRFGWIHHRVVRDGVEMSLRESVDLMRAAIGAPAFPWVTVPTSADFGANVSREGFDMRWPLELNEGIGRIVSTQAVSYHERPFRLDRNGVLYQELVTQEYFSPFTVRLTTSVAASNTLPLIFAPLPIREYIDFFDQYDVSVGQVQARAGGDVDILERVSISTSEDPENLEEFERLNRDQILILPGTGQSGTSIVSAGAFHRDSGDLQIHEESYDENFEVLVQSESQELSQDYFLGSGNSIPTDYASLMSGGSLSDKYLWARPGANYLQTIKDYAGPGPPHFFERVRYGSKEAVAQGTAVLRVGGSGSHLLWKAPILPPTWPDDPYTN